MFRLNEIALTNFRSYKGSHQFTFPSEVGLYYFTGQNTKSMGANGAGKSTLLDAIVWALYGRTTRGLKGRDVITWGQTSCRVELECALAGTVHRIKRSQKPNTIHLDGRPVDQQELERTLRLNCSAFLHAVIKPQFGFEFLSMLPSEKLTLFSDILHLDYWLAKAGRATDETGLIDAELLETQSTLDKTTGKVEMTALSIEELQAKSDSFDADKSNRLAAAKAIANESTRKILAADDKFMDGVWVTEDRIKFLERIRDDYLLRMSLYQVAKAKHEAKIEFLTANLGKKPTIGERCIECDTLITQQVLNENSHEIRPSDLEGYKSRLAAEKRHHDAALRAMIKTKSELAAAQANREQRAGVLAKINALTQQSDILWKEVNRIKAETNPYIELLVEKKSTLKALKKKIAEGTKLLAEFQIEHDATAYWVKGFKRVRLFLIEQAFTTLELEVNNSLAQLGMPDWQITFDIERENQTGGITKGFITFVQGPDNPEPVRWESWSGGESQRLQLAANVGLSNLIMQQAGLVNTIEFYDEPSTHLSPEGMMDLANLLHDRAINEEKQIWIVDHAAITNFGEFKGIVTVRKTKNGSELEFRQG